MADGKPTTPGLNTGTDEVHASRIEEAASPFVDREQEMEIAIEEGFEDYRNGDVVDHEVVMANLEAIIARARKAAA